MSTIIMGKETERKTNAILKIIAESKEPIGSGDISKRLQDDHGLELSERTVRYHLKIMNDLGLLRIIWKEGRMITQKGREELDNSMVAEKVGLISSKIEELSYLMDFDLEKKAGSVILNVSFFHKSDFGKALKIMREVFEKKFSMGDRAMVAVGGEEIGEIAVPAGKIGFGTLCAINLNGILLKSGIPVDSKFGGVLQIENSKPLRFTELINYSGSTLDPHEIFIRSKMTGVRKAVAGSGKVLAGFREIPAVSLDDAEAVFAKASAAGFSRPLYIGKPGQPVLGIPVGVEKAGVVIPGGLNPIAAAEEWGCAN